MPALPTTLIFRWAIAANGQDLKAVLRPLTSTRTSLCSITKWVRAWWSSLIKLETAPSTRYLAATVTASIWQIAKFCLSVCKPVSPTIKSITQKWIRNSWFPLLTSSSFLILASVRAAISISFFWCWYVDSSVSVIFYVSWFIALSAQILFCSA